MKSNRRRTRESSEINTPWTRDGPGGLDRMLAIKRRKYAIKTVFFTKEVFCAIFLLFTASIRSQSLDQPLVHLPFLSFFFLLRLLLFIHFGETPVTENSSPTPYFGTGVLACATRGGGRSEAGHCFGPGGLRAPCVLLLLLLTHFEESPMCENLFPQYFGKTRRFSNIF